MPVTVGPFTGIGEEYDPSDESSDPKKWPSWFNGVHLTELQGSTVSSFPNEASMRAGGSPAMGQSAFAWTQDTGTLWAFFSGSWRAMVSANGGAWSTKTPVWRYINNGALSDAMSYGNGRGVMRYSTSGKTVHFSMTITRGSSTNMGAGDYFFELPKIPKVYTSVGGTATISLTNAKSGPALRNATVQGVGAGRFALLLNDNSGKRLSHLTGSSDGKAADGWSPGDEIVVNGFYEQA